MKTVIDLGCVIKDNAEISVRKLIQICMNTFKTEFNMIIF